MIDRLVTDLPEPDSPTTATVSPRFTSKLTPSTDLATRLPSSKCVLQIRDLEHDIVGQDRHRALIHPQCGQAELSRADVRGGT